jgi:hypothetical protein
MPRPTEKDGLDAGLELIRSFGSRKKIPCFSGAVDADPESGPIIRYVPEEVSNTSVTISLANISSFLDILERLDVAMIVTAGDTLTEEGWQDAVSLYETALEEIAASQAETGVSTEPGSEYAQSKEDLTEFLREAKAAKSHIGALATLDVWAITRHPTTMLNCYQAVEWWSAVNEADGNCDVAVEAVQDSEDDAEDDSPTQVTAQREYEAMAEQRRYWTAEKRKETARQLAAHPDFGRCKTESDKVYLLESLVGDVPAHDVMKKEIARAAGAVYKFEVATKKS